MTDTNTAEREALMKLVDAYAEASFDQGLHQRTEDDAPEAARKKLEKALRDALAGRASLAASAIETNRYADGTTATGIGPLPKHSPSVQHALRVLTDVESMLDGANGPTIQIRAVLESLAASAGGEPWGAFCGGRVWVGRLPAHVPKMGLPIQLLYTHPSPPEGMAGWKLVPIEPTEAMKAAAVKYANGSAVYKNVGVEVLRIEEGIYGEVYEAMIAAAPPPPASEAKEL